jgi:hypothetical protein
MLADSYSPTPKELAISVLSIVTMMSRLSLFKTWTHLKAAPREHWAWEDRTNAERARGSLVGRNRDGLGRDGNYHISPFTVKAYAPVSHR